MTLVVETGTGVAGAESYASISAIDTYWTARQNSSFYATWTALSTAVKEGAAREASAYLDAVYGQFYRGTRQGYIQGLQWPRSKAYDEADLLITGVPPELVAATCELAARAGSAPLVPDATVAGTIKRVSERVEGAVSTETEYTDGASEMARYGTVRNMLTPILINSLHGAWGFR